MPLLAGWVRGPDGFFEGWLRVDEGRIARIGRGVPPSAPDHRGVIVPRPVNAHTHVADFVARGTVPPKATLAELFEPPHGLKHRILAATPPEDLVAGMRRAVAELSASGARATFDFREGGPDGARLLKDAVASTPGAPRTLALGRLAPHVAADDRRAIRAVLEAADGLGISALRDVGPAAARAMAEEARAVGKPVALHFSEAERESVDDALVLRPAFVVHGSHATPGDLARLGDARVPLVVCPRSNVRLAKLANLDAASAAGVTLHLGTDNAMLQSLSVWDEARTLHATSPGFGADAVLDALLGPAEGFTLGGFTFEPVAEESRASLLVLSPEGRDPRAAILGADAPKILATIGEHP